MRTPSLDSLCRSITVICEDEAVEEVLLYTRPDDKDRYVKLHAFRCEDCESVHVGVEAIGPPLESGVWDREDADRQMMESINEGGTMSDTEIETTTTTTTTTPDTDDGDQGDED